jgi:CarboxypepD_reg-like domain
MRFFIALSFLCFSFKSNAQYINCIVQDSENKNPLYYATIFYGKEQRVTFSDSSGRFFLQSNILKGGDSITIQFIGYTSKSFPTADIKEGSIFLLEKNHINLQEVIVTNCGEYIDEDITFESNIKLANHYSTSPFGRILFGGDYSISKQKMGYIQKVKFHINPFIFYMKT